MDKNAIRDLYVHAFRGTSPDVTTYSAKDVKDTLREEIHAIAHDYNSYRRNKNDLFEILQEAYDEIIPESVSAFVGAFAEIKTVLNGQKASFVRKTGRNRAKSFVTRVGLSGVYEAFRLDKDTFEVSADAVGGAAYIDFERYLAGDEDITESTDILLEGIQEAIYREILKALLATVNSTDMPAANMFDVTSFDSELMAKACAIAKTYGGGSAVIFATPEFIAKMGPDAVGMPVYGPYALTNSPAAGSAAGYATPMYSPKDIQDIATTGYITTFRGTPIVQMPQSFTDEDNEVYQTPPSVAYVFPTGSEKIVKVVFEGDTIVDEWKNRDRSFEIEAYKKIGVAILSTNNWCIYRNRELETTEYAILPEFKKILGI